MKKKNAYIAAIAAGIILAAGIWLSTRPEELGSMNHTYGEPETSVSSFSFQGDAGGRIKVSFASDIRSGDLDIILYDSEGKEVWVLGRAKELQTFITLESSDTYTFAAECSGFVGKFRIKVDKAR